MKKHKCKHTQSGKQYGLAAIIITSALISPVYASDIKFSGFLSVGGGFVDDDKSFAYNGYSDSDLTFDNNLLGLQLTSNISDKLTATAQLISRSVNDYDVKAEWAYVSYQLSDSTKVRAGRLRTPFYMYSDYLDVGYAYSWITPPSEVYTSPFNNVDGIDLYTTATYGGFDTTLQVYYGGFTGDLSINDVEVAVKSRKQIGVAGTIGKNWWTLRAAYHQTKFSLDLSATPVATLATTLTAFGFTKNANNLLVEEDDATFAEVGLNIDTGKFIAAFEHTELEPKDSYLAKNIAEFLMVGVRQGNWLFHITGAQSRDDAAHPETGIPANVSLPGVGSTDFLIATLQTVAESQVRDRDIITIGTRWDFTTSAALKFQIDSIKDNRTDADQKVFSVALQTVF